MMITCTFFVCPNSAVICCALVREMPLDVVVLSVSEITTEFTRPGPALL